MKKNWNPVLNKFVEIKEKYINKFDNITYNSEGSKTCLERWVEYLNEDEYNKIISPLQLNQYGDLLLIRYGRYSDVFSGEEDITFDELWSMYDGFYLECRSIVINVKTNELVLTPFKKFRNLNECEETSLENIMKRIKSAECVEFSNKLDGSMQSARCYNGNFIMAGSMSLDPDNSWRLQDGYNMLDERYKLMLKENLDLTFIFEYISLKDSHIVKYNKEDEGLYLIGARNVNNGDELSYSDVLKFSEQYNIPATEVYNKTLEDVVKELGVHKSSEKEGFVVNIDGYKVKIKCDDYVNMHRILSSISSINLIIKNIADDTFDDMLSKVPSAYRDSVMKVAKVVFKYNSDMKKECDYYMNNYNNYKKEDTKRDFMLYVSKYVPFNLQGYCRELYLGKSINFIKSQTNSKTPKYKRLNEMGVTNYNDIF